MPRGHPGLVVFDYESAWAWSTQPQGADFDYFRLAFAAYRALRKLGLSVDILPPDVADLTAYKLVLVSGVMTLSAPLRAALQTAPGRVLLGPRTNSKTVDFAIPVPLPPALPGMEAVVTRVESLPPDASVPLAGGGAFRHWFEHLEGKAEVLRATADGAPAIVRAGALDYLAGWPDDATFVALLRDLCAESGVETVELPEGLRLRDAGPVRFAFNYGPEPVMFDGAEIPAAGVHWRTR